MDKFKILIHGQQNIKYKEFNEIAEAIKCYYNFNKVDFWMWKAFQFGFAYGKHAERAREKVQHDKDTGIV